MNDSLSWGFFLLQDCFCFVLCSAKLFDPFLMSVNKDHNKDWRKRLGQNMFWY
jgi:hypothetical protein